MIPSLRPSIGPATIPSRGNRPSVALTTRVIYAAPQQLRYLCSFQSLWPHESSVPIFYSGKRKTLFRETASVHFEKLKVSGLDSPGSRPTQTKLEPVKFHPCEVGRAWGVSNLFHYIPFLTPSPLTLGSRHSSMTHTKLSAQRCWVSIPKDPSLSRTHVCTHTR